MAIKTFISDVLQVILFIIGIPFYIVDSFSKNRLCEFLIKKINHVCLMLNWWGKK